MFVFDTSKDDFETVMRGYHALAMKFLWEKGERGVTTGETWVHVNKILMEKKESISRASIIQFLSKIEEKGLATFIEKPGKGGYHRVYFPAYDEESFRRSIADKVISKLLEIWPEETRAILVEKLS